MGVLKFVLALVFLGMAVAEPRWHNSTDGRQYLINGDQKYNWLSAQRECSRRNLQLVEIDSEAKNQDLVQLLRSVFGDSTDLWLGANDEYNKNKDYDRPFYWRSSGKRMDYTNWSENNPSNLGSNEHCVHTWAKAPNFEWNDLACDDKIGYICEDQPSYTMYRKGMQVKGQKVIDINRKLFDNQREEQRKVMAKLNRIMDLIEKKNNEIENFLGETHENLGHDFEHDIDLHNREVLTFVSDTLKTTRELDAELKNAANQMDSDFSNEFNKAKQVIDYVLGNINVSYE